MPFEKKQQVVIFAIAAALAMVFVLFWYLPSYKRLKSLKQERAKLVMVADKAKNLKRQLPELKAQLVTLQQATANYEQRIPDYRGLGEFLHGITNLMNEHNLKDQQIQPGEEVKTGQLYCIPVSMKCKGRLVQLFEFYKSLQSFDRLVRIEQMELVNDGDFKGRLGMQTKASIYYRTQKQGKKPLKERHETAKKAGQA
jgi:Tfp pilus assembly protein PilO